MSTPRPDLPAEARLREAARSYRLAAARLRRANPGRRATSRHAEVDLAPDGRLQALRVLATGLAGTALAADFTALHEVATGGRPAGDGIGVADLPQDPDQPSPGLGGRRFQLPAGVDPQAPPAVMMQQLCDHLRHRMAAAEQASAQAAGVVGEGRSSGGHVTLSLNQAGQLHGITVTSWSAELPLPALNDALAEALAQAEQDLGAPR
ncbi:hypothetical protein [Aestuariimicrobium sp. Y1814]|uniref:hypothetical protein n=1 Tax=Aestuariimicrobium sp. Y1814 TaxID=3418742 RepID=UPI003DA73DC0